MRSTLRARGDAILAALGDTARVNGAPLAPSDHAGDSPGWAALAQCVAHDYLQDWAALAHFHEPQAPTDGTVRNIEQWIGEDSDSLCDFEQWVDDPPQEPATHPRSSSCKSTDGRRRFNLFPRTSNFMQCIVKNTFLELESEHPPEHRPFGTPRRRRSVPTSFRISGRRPNAPARSGSPVPSIDEHSVNDLPTQTVAEFVDDPDAPQQQGERLDVLVNIDKWCSDLEIVPHGEIDVIRSECQSPKRRLSNFFTKTSNHVKCIVKNTFLEVNFLPQPAPKSRPAVRRRSWPTKACLSQDLKTPLRERSRTIDMLIKDTPTVSVAEPIPLDAHRAQVEQQSSLSCDNGVRSNESSNNQSHTIAEFFANPVCEQQVFPMVGLGAHSFGRAGASSSILRTDSPDREQVPDAGAQDSVRSKKKSKKGAGRFLNHGAKYLVGIEPDQGFNVMYRLIGPSAQHTKSIAKGSKGVKMQIRGRGAKQPEAEDDGDPAATGPLSIFLKAPSSPKLDVAAVLVENLLCDVHQQYRHFCVEHGLSAPDLIVARLEDS